MNNNLTIAFGERVLNDAGFPFDKVERVDFTVEGDRGYSAYTPGWSEYPVYVHYVRDDAPLFLRRTYKGLWEIIGILEEIDDDIRDSW